MDEDLSEAEVEAFRQRLLARRAALAEESRQSSGDRKPVELDQQSVGRLSRMDALQQQAMAEALEGRRGQELRRIELALARIEDGSFGACQRCGELVARRRLELDPTIALCVDCAGARAGG